MHEGDPAATAPMAAPPPAKKSGGIGVWRILALGILAFALGLSSGRLDPGSLISGARDLIDGAPAVGAITTERETVATIKEVIERANRAQQEAFARRDPTLMRATATVAYYQELADANREMAASGVMSIELVGIDWGEVTVDGATARATTLETWRSSWVDGSTDERTDRNEYTLVQEGRGTWRISSDVHPDARVLDPATGTSPGVTQPGPPAAVVSRSSNWSGYAASGGVFTAVTGSWIVPTVSATSSGADATWVGIGGLSTRDLIQAGTQGTVSGSGEVRYHAWIEMLPDASRPVPLSVSAGDAVTVTLTEQQDDEWLISMKNDTTGETYGVTVRYSSSNSSAEWVQEAPSVGRGIVPLDRFGTLQFTAGSAIRDGESMSLAELGARAITMINGAGETLAQPSTLGSDGSSFTVTRTDASNTPSNGGRRRRP
jgi:hypothetical protein